jgi:hypothetical protein
MPNTLGREDWVTLPQAVAHICSAKGYGDEKIAQRELRATLAMGLRPLGPLRWQRERDDESAPFGTIPVTRPTDTPPSGPAWLEAKIRWKIGLVRNDWGEYKHGKWRVLLIARRKVLQTWPLSVEASQQEDLAIEALASHLKNNKQMSRPEAAEWLKENDHSLGKRAFARVWPEARARAGLLRIAPPGRKRKSSR